ncbi:MAG: hypothetical protein QOD77_1301 [Thermoplasmata archaeon]|jgi:hypothetical protein|nr:hypothetical protein [Thermoplasmata archaeon]
MKLLVAALVAALLLAGCSSDSGDGTSSSTSGTGTSGGGTTGKTTTTTTKGTGTTGTGTGPGGVDPAPTITFLPSVVSGQAPLLVNFTIDGKDPEGESISWSVDLGDGSPPMSGTTLPSKFSHNYTVVGNHTAKAVVTDGNNNVNKTVVIAVLPATGPGSEGPGQEINLAWVGGSLDAGTFPEFLNCEPGPGAGVTHDTFTTDPATIGLPFKATITDASTAGVVDWTIFFNLSDCSEYAGTFTADGYGVIEGVVPPGSDFGYMFSTGGANIEVTYQSGSKIVA